MTMLQSERVTVNEVVAHGEGGVRREKGPRESFPWPLLGWCVGSGVDPGVVGQAATRMLSSSAWAAARSTGPKVSLVIRVALSPIRP